MIDTFKLKFFKGIMVTVGILVIFFIGLGFGQMGKNPSHSSSTTSTKPKKVKEGSQLTEGWVKQFLIAYYTKKDLAENRSRYKPYLTESLYQMVTTEEETAKNQAYKGFKVNYEFQSATIAIDASHHQVIADITYTNDLLKEKNTTRGAQKGTSHHITLRLDYLKQDDRYLINQITPVDMSVAEGVSLVADPDETLSIEND